MKKIVYNKETGKMVEVEAIDATEYVKTGGWSYEPIENKDEPEIKEASVIKEKKELVEAVKEVTKKKK